MVSNVQKPKMISVKCIRFDENHINKLKRSMSKEESLLSHLGIDLNVSLYKFGIR